MSTYLWQLLLVFPWLLPGPPILSHQNVLGRSHWEVRGDTFLSQIVPVLTSPPHPVTGRWTHPVEWTYSSWGWEVVPQTCSGHGGNILSGIWNRWWDCCCTRTAKHSYCVYRSHNSIKSFTTNFAFWHFGCKTSSTGKICTRVTASKIQSIF